MESGQHSTSPESIHEEDRFKDLPEFKSGSNSSSQSISETVQDYWNTYLKALAFIYGGDWVRVLGTWLAKRDGLIGKQNKEDKQMVDPETVKSVLSAVSGSTTPAAAQPQPAPVIPLPPQLAPLPSGLFADDFAAAAKARLIKKTLPVEPDRQAIDAGVRIKVMQPRIPELPITILPTQPVDTVRPQLQLQPQPLLTSPGMVEPVPQAVLEQVTTDRPDSGVMSFIKSVTSPQDGLYISTLPQKEHPSLYEEENPNRGFTIGYKLSF